MDLGATVCTPRNPACARCPWRKACAAHARGKAEAYPKRDAKAARPTRRGMAFWTARPDGAVLLRRRPEKGLLGGMIELPTTPWRGRGWSLASALPHAPFAADWRRLPGTVHHGFTHFALDLVVLCAEVEANDDGMWRRPDTFEELALPTLTKKLIRHALSHLSQIKDHPGSGG